MSLLFGIKERLGILSTNALRKFPKYRNLEALDHITTTRHKLLLRDPQVSPYIVCSHFSS